MNKKIVTEKQKQPHIDLLTGRHDLSERCQPQQPDIKRDSICTQHGKRNCQLQHKPFDSQAFIKAAEALQKEEYKCHCGGKGNWKYHGVICYNFEFVDLPVQQKEELLTCTGFCGKDINHCTCGEPNQQKGWEVAGWSNKFREKFNGIQIPCPDNDRNGLCDQHVNEIVGFISDLLDSQKQQILGLPSMQEDGKDCHVHEDCLVVNGNQKPLNDLRSQLKQEIEDL